MLDDFSETGFDAVQGRKKVHKNQIQFDPAKAMKFAISVIDLLGEIDQ